MFFENMTLDEYREVEPLWDQAIALAKVEAEMSITKMQRHLKLGYNRAARLCERLEKEGYLVQRKDQYSWRRAHNG